MEMEMVPVPEPNVDHSHTSSTAGGKKKCQKDQRNRVSKLKKDTKE